MCRIIRPSINEKRRLVNAYEMTKEGPIVYETRQCVENLITKVNNVNSEFIPLIPLQDDSVQRPEFVLRNQFEVDMAIADMFRSDGCEELRIYILAQPVSGVLIDSLRLLLKRSEVPTNIHHGVRLSSSVDAIENVRNFAKMVPLMFIRNEKVQYAFSYHYVSELAHDRFSGIYPNVIIRNERALLLSSDMTSGIILSNHEQVCLLINDAQGVMSQMEPLSFFHNSFDELCDFYAQLTDTDFPEVYYLEQQPCVEFCNPKSYQAFVKNSQPKVYDLMVRRYDSFKRHLAKGVSYHQFFTRSGIDKILNDGIHLDIPKRMFDYSDTSKMLPSFLREIIDCATGNDNFSLHMVPDNFLDINLSCGFIAVFRGYCVIIAINPLIENYHSPTVVIHEEGVVNAFSDYFSSLISKRIFQDEKVQVTSGNEAINYIRQRMESENK